MKRNAAVLIFVGVCGLTVVGSFWYARHTRRNLAAPNMVYDARGYGGFVPASPAQAALGGSRKAHGTTMDQPIRTAQDAYNAGRYDQSEVIAASIVQRSVAAPTLPNRRTAALARQIMAYSAARRHDLKLARQRFTLLQRAAASLPGGGPEPSFFGQDSPTLEQEAAFQHAVCTAALGDHLAAETEYRAFMNRYPESPLVNAAMKRVERMYAGDLPARDRAVWQHAKHVSAKAAQARARSEAMCGPECLAELLRRIGKPASPGSLANAMGTSERGTTLAALAETARKYGWQPRGMELTQKGLAEQPLPVIALLAPGHYVIVDKVAPESVTIWDPDADGIGRGKSVTVGLDTWRQVWRGVALALDSARTNRPATAEIANQTPSKA